MKKYDKYKDSGIEWIGKIPESWQVKRIKQVTKYEIGGTPSRTKMEYFEGENLWVSIADLNGKDIINDTKEKITDKAIEDSNCKKIPKGSLLYSFKLSVGLTAFAGQELYTNEAIAAFLPNSKMNLNYLRNIVTGGFENNARENIYGAKLFNQRTLNDAPLISPPNEDQIIISDYLDEATKKLNKVIENKKRQIELLKENRRVLVQETSFTGTKKALDYIHTEDRWVGRIPQHWSMRKLKNVAIMVFSNVNKKIEIGEQSVFLCNYMDVYKNDYINNTLNFMSATASEQEIQKFLIKKEDVLVTKDSETPEDIAISALVTEDTKNVICGYHLALIRADKKVISGKYLFQLFQSDSFRAQFTFASNGVTRFGLGLYPFNNALIPVPTMPEQLEIIKFLEDITSKFKKSTQIIEQEISALEEYKKILINDVVTGKMKVTA